MFLYRSLPYIYCSSKSWSQTGGRVQNCFLIAPTISSSHFMVQVMNAASGSKDQEEELL